MLRCRGELQVTGEAGPVSDVIVDHFRLEKSKERVKKWPNTINALRKKKDATRFERFKVDEEERRRVE